MAKGQGGLLKTKYKILYNFFSKTLSSMTNTIQKSTQEPRHISQIAHHRPFTTIKHHTTTHNHKHRHYTPHLKHPITISPSHSHTSPQSLSLFHTHTHTLTPTTVSWCNNSNHSPGAYSHPEHFAPWPLQTRWASREAPPRQPRRLAASQPQQLKPLPHAPLRGRGSVTCRKRPNAPSARGFWEVM